MTGTSGSSRNSPSCKKASLPTCSAVGLSAEKCSIKARALSRWSGLYSQGKTPIQTRFGPLPCKPANKPPKCYLPMPKTGFGGGLVCILKERLNPPKCNFPMHKQVLGGACLRTPKKTQPAQMLFCNAQGRFWGWSGLYSQGKAQLEHD